MQLSDAMRLGAMSRPQGRYLLFRVDDQDNPTHSCALGAAYEGRFGCPEMRGQVTQVRFHGELNRQWPLLYNYIPLEKLPESLVRAFTGIYDELNLGVAITQLNDNYGWSRQRIADWLDTLGLDLEEVKATPEAEATARAPQAASLVEAAA